MSILSKIITTSKAQILVIGGLPEDAENPRIILSSLFWGKDQNTQVVHNMPEGKWTSIGFLKDVNEDEAKELVEYKNIVSDHPCEICGYDVDCYRNYIDQKDIDWEKNPIADRYHTGKESLLSLIESNVKLKNKFGEFPDKHNTGLNYGMEYIGKVQEWEAEQETVFTNLFIMIKK